MDDLEHRTGLPDALRVLAETLPREDWERHPNFDGLTRFWMERHLMFRDLVARLSEGAEARLDGRIEPGRHAAETSRYAGFLLSQLHGHHQIEDHHYFPVLRDRDPRIAAGFDLLDADHHALDGILNGFVEQANAAIRGIDGDDPRRDAAALHAGLAGLERMIERHLTDEEDLIVPVILRDGSAGLG